ncbi:hypothetical protein MKW94_005014 [Papaver nudicaule]|uniref:Diacylglycerol O-acyltransferase n=1 Tax=Papaver nudicaule TaxID=74823 RepID=A0AA41VLH4_PAPNU|nr:hypothetical protein [Papaver nudicaule]
MDVVAEGLSLRKKSLKAITTKTSTSEDEDHIKISGGLEEPLSPSARLLHEPHFNLYIIAIIGVKTKINPAVVKAGLVNTLLKHPRFCSLQVEVGEKGGKMKWVPTEVNLENHVIVPDIDPDMNLSGDKFVEDYISDLTKTKIDMAKPLWELHLLNVKTVEAEAVGVFRIHHSLGDGTSLISLLLACTRQTADPDALPTVPVAKSAPVRSGNYKGILWIFVVVWSFLQLAWNTLVDISMFFATSMFVKDTETPLKGAPGVEFEPKRFVHRSVSLDDIKLVKNAMNMTINDVVLGVTTAALSRYLNRRYGEDAKNDLGATEKRNNLPKNIRLRSTLLVNIRPSSGIQALSDMMEEKAEAKWGNWIGYVLFPFIIALRDDPLDYVREAKLVIDRKKNSYEALYTFVIAEIVLKLFGIKASAALTHRILTHTTMSFSNVVGPSEEIGFYGHEMSYIAPSVYGHPHAFTINYQSYVNKMAIVLAVDEKAVPDPHRLCDDLEESLQLIKDAVVRSSLRNKPLKAVVTKSSSSSSSISGSVLKKESSGGFKEEQEEELLCSSARLFHEPKFNLHIIALLGCKTKIDVSVIKDGLLTTLLKHPRFCREMKWVPTEVNIENHIIVPEISPIMDVSPDKFVEDYISELSKTTIDMSKPLWELHILNVKTAEAEAVGVFKVHHSIGDGTSLISLLLACTRQTADPSALPTVPVTKKRAVGSKNLDGVWWMFAAVWGVLAMVRNSLVDIFMFFATFFFFKDMETPIKGAPGVEFGPKRIVHRTLSLDDIKLVKNAMDMTINDVLLGVTTGGLSCYLNRRYGEEKKNDQGATEKRNNLPKNIRLRSTLLVNMRPSSGIQVLSDMMEDKAEAKWGNWIGYILNPFTISLRDDPLDYVREAKIAVDRKKNSCEALYTYFIGEIVPKLFGYKASAALSHRILSNTTMSCSNLIGPLEEIGFYGHPMAYLAPTFYGHPQALTINYQSYVNKMIIILAVDERAIPDPHKLCDDLEESLKLIKDAILAKHEHVH